MRPEVGTVINIIFSKKVYSCVGISTAINGSFGLRPVSLGGLIGQVQFQLLECRVDVFTNQVRKRKREHSY